MPKRTAGEERFDPRLLRPGVRRAVGFGGLRFWRPTAESLGV